jgi:hypothetical protein
MDMPPIITGAIIAHDSALHAAHESPEIPKEREQVVDSNLSSNDSVGGKRNNAIAHTTSTPGAAPNSLNHDPALLDAALPASTASELFTANDAQLSAQPTVERPPANFPAHAQLRQMRRTPCSHVPARWQAVRRLPGGRPSISAKAAHQEKVPEGCRRARPCPRVGPLFHGARVIWADGIVFANCLLQGSMPLGLFQGIICRLLSALAKLLS